MSLVLFVSKKKSLFQKGKSWPPFNACNVAPISKGAVHIYTIIYKGNGFVKRLQRSVDGVKIISDNRHYDPMFESSESDDFRVIGKVRSVMHNM